MIKLAFLLQTYDGSEVTPNGSSYTTLDIPDNCVLITLFITWTSSGQRSLYVNINPNDASFLNDANSFQSGNVSLQSFDLITSLPYRSPNLRLGLKIKEGTLSKVAVIFTQKSGF